MCQYTAARGVLSCITFHSNLSQWTSSGFTARRYARAVFAVVMCPSVRPSVRHKPLLCVEATERIKLVFGTEATFDLSYSVLFCSLVVLDPSKIH